MLSPNLRNIKICGLSTPETVQAVLDGGASHVGFIFFEKSPRHVTPEQAAPLAALAKAHLTNPAKSVAVTVNADDATLDAIITIMKPDIIQFHGKEEPARLAEIKAHYGLEVWKALAVSTVDDLKKAEPFIGIADRMLFDAKPPKDAVLPGGNAVSFDWTILNKLPAGTDYLLAGGLDATNVRDAITIAAPPGLDISSGVESAPGVKDIAMITEFLCIAKNA